MDLQGACANALELTERMAAALEAGDHAAAEALLPARGEAMALLETVHRAAGAAERANARDAVALLAEADSRLQAAAAAGLEAADREVRRTRGAAPAQRGSYDQHPTQACVDRRA